jgi:hypothetical protein
LLRSLLGPIDSKGVIHGCYKTAATSGSHTLVLQNVGTSCPSGYTAIKWNQKGVQGPPGPAGSVATDYGIVQVAGNDNAPVCSFVEKYGPDPLTITGKLITDPYSGNAEDTCEISDFPTNAVPMISAVSHTPPNVLQYTPGGPLDVEVGLVANYPTLPAPVFSFAIIDPSS